MLKYLLYILYVLIGVSLGVWLMPTLFQLLPFDLPLVLDNVLVHGLAGLLLFLLLFLWTVPKVESLIRRSEALILNRSLAEIVSATLGMIVGLLIAVLISLLINAIDIPLIGDIIPFILAVILGYLGFQIGLKKFSEVLDFLPGNFSKSQEEEKRVPRKFLDTSAIIDGRIVDVAKTGFIEGELVIPQFVLDELQLIADATDPIKRDKGQRGLDMLNTLQEQSDNVTIMPVDYDKLDVDHQLIEAAKAEQGAIITTDYNLNKVCQLHQIPVLNVNQLSEAIKVVVIQGDTFDLLISKTGKEENQGVGYLEDGTMVVVEEGRSLINKTVKVEVVSVLQTNSGRIVFARKVRRK
ncbi:PIN/TRAM domain-containing protein [Salinicoccus roseus]|nr:TRAM domain-containing protein [Salinicoccus roseus]MDB0580934.1 TRAM domain-containing protein [Salinicoccus roseus]